MDYICNKEDKILNPLISIVMPTYNRGNIIKTSINSVLQQEYQKWELLIVDDYSMDNTNNIVCEYTKIDGRIRYIVNNGEKGFSSARNKGLKECRGQYIAFLDSDELRKN